MTNKEVPVGLEESPTTNVMPRIQTVSNKNLLKPGTQMVSQQISEKRTRLEPDQPDDVKNDKEMDGNWPTHPHVPIPNGKAL